MKDLYVTKGLPKQSQQCPSRDTQRSGARTRTWEAEGYPSLAKTTWTSAPARWGFTPSNYPTSQLSSLSAGLEPLCPPLSSSGTSQLLYTKKNSIVWEKSCVSVPRSPSLQLSHGMTAKTSTCRGKLHELSLLQVEERYLPDCYSVQCFKCVLFSHCGMFLLWMFATSSQKFQWRWPKPAVELYFQFSLIQLTSCRYKLFIPQYDVCVWSITFTGGISGSSVWSGMYVKQAHLLCKTRGFIKIIFKSLLFPF